LAALGRGNPCAGKEVVVAGEMHPRVSEASIDGNLLGNLPDTA
jgi:hypothetical protein